ncbi:type I polyketide synthase [Methylolobus aquaticus]
MRQVALVGYAFRLPGASPDRLWQSLCDGSNLVSTVDDGRWAKDHYLHPNRNEPGSTYTFAAGSVGDVTGFDAGFFGISPREAGQMDPQQRLLLELAWETMEHAGIRPSALQGSHSAVYIGLSSIDYAYRRADDLGSIDASTMTGNTASIAANRISYFFDLKGPSVTVDTACSSALVAFHLACQSIRSGECTQALTGGISLHLHPFAFVGFSKASMLSPDGTCRVFDDSGDGYVRSEGGGLFLLKDLDQAIADGDRILAVVAGSGSNCDGRTQGLTVPSDAAQARLLREVYTGAGVSPEELDYLEAHGTGTRVGDPIEATAIGRALGQRRAPDKPLLIGSVKSNLGHLEAASGVAGLVKALLCLEHRTVPPSIHLQTPNTRIPFDTLNIRVVSAVTPLPTDKTLVIGVNSFGFGGANAHVILKSPPPGRTDTRSDAVDDFSAPLLLSGRSDTAARTAAREFAEYLQNPQVSSFYDALYTAAFHRDHHDHRMVAWAPTREALAALLVRTVGAEDTPGVSSGRALSRASKPVFVYSGNGSQWAGMGRNLLQAEPGFRHAVEEVDALFCARGGFSILSELAADDEAQRLDATEIAQPLLFAVQVGLTSLLRAWGVEAMALVGHSVGEVAAAWASGALSLPQAVEVVHVRSLEQGHTRGTGGMTAVGLSQDAIGEILDTLPPDERPAVAGINSPRGVTLAGTLAALSRVECLLTEREVYFRRLPLDYPFHSAAMDPLQDPIKHSLADLKPRTARLPFFSTVTGGALPGDKLNGSYWWRNVREPVQFQAAIETLIERGANVFVEIGPHAVLRNYIGDCLRQSATEGRVIPAMLRSDDRVERVRDALFQVMIAGSPVDFGKLFPHRGRLAEIPHYPWQRERCWHPITPDAYDLIHRSAEHPLLGYRLAENPWQWENHLDCTRFPDLADHRIGESVVFPAAGFIAMALAAAELRFGGASQTIEDFEIRAPLLLEAATSKTVRLAIDDEYGNFSIRSRERSAGGLWHLNAVGRLLTPGHAVKALPRRTPPRRPPDLLASAHYAACQALGLDYGPAFQSLDKIWLGPSGAIAQLRTEVRVESSSRAERVTLPQLDGSFQLLLGIVAQARSRTGEASAFVPTGAARIVQYSGERPGALAQASLRRRNPRSLLGDFALRDALGTPVMELDGVRFRQVNLAEGSVEPLRPLQFAAVPMPLRAPQAALPTTDMLCASAQAALHGATRILERKRYYEEVEPLVDVLCTAFAERTLRSLCPEDQPIDPARLAASAALGSGMGPYVHRLLEFLQEDGIVEPADGVWRWCPDSGTPEPVAVWASLIGDYPDYALPVITAGRVGLHLLEVLSGQVDAAALLQPGDLNRVSVRGNDPGAGDFRTAAAGIVLTAVAQMPPHRRLRIVEVSCGQTPLAPYVLTQVDQTRVDYLIITPTDAGPADRTALLQRFRYLRTRQLDLMAPDALSLEPELPIADILVLTEGFSELDNPRGWLGCTERLLAQDGLLLAIDEYPSRRADLVWGAQHDWWLAGTHAGPISRLRPPHHWGALVASSGLAQTRIIQDLPGVDSGYFLLLARNAACPPETTVDPETPAQTWLVVHDPQPTRYAQALGNAVASKLRSLGHRVIAARPGLDFTHEPEEDGSATQKPLPRFDALLTQGREVTGIVLLGDPEAADDSPQHRLQQQCQRSAATLHILNRCRALGRNTPCWLVTRGAAAHLLPTAVRSSLSAPPRCDDAAVWGFMRTVMNEYPDIPIRLVDCADPDRLERMAADLVDELLTPQDEDEIVLTGSGRFAPRLVETAVPPLAATSQPSEPCDGVFKLDFSVPGPLKNLVWRRVASTPLANDQVEIAVRAAGLNFRDVMYAMGLLSDEAVEAGFAGPTLGMELAGTVIATGSEVRNFKPGDAVMAFAPSSFATRAVTPAGAVAHKPAGWSFAAAATVPIAFFTVFYALRHLAQLAEGERILIHGAAGGVGIAAIQLAHYCGAEIFATAGSDEKRDFVRLLGADHVFDSRSLDFADEILERTGGVGVDVVLNSLAGEAIHRNLRVLRPFGRFLELGKRDFYENTKIGLRPFRNNISYFGIDADQLMTERPDLTRRLFSELLELFENESLKPLPYRAFGSQDIVDAFRHMQQSRHIGKIVVTMEPDAVHWPDVSAPSPPLALSPDKTYLISGGLSGFGLKTAEWLVAKGARHLALISRSGAAASDGEARIAAMAAEGVDIRCLACDVASRSAVNALLAELQQHAAAPLGGVIHAAAVIADGMSHALTGDQIMQAYAPKILGAQAFADHARRTPLDFLVFFSSATTLFGNPGQANYVGANHYLEALAEELRAEGLRAYCIAFGPIADAGYLARHDRIRQNLEERLGGKALTAVEALDWLERMLANEQSGFGVVNLNWSALRRMMPTANAPKYRALLPDTEANVDDATDAETVRRWLAEMPDEEFIPRLIEILKREVAEILRIAQDRLDEHRSVHDLGMDSLMGMELITALEKRVGVRVPVMLLSEGPSIARLAERITRQLRGGSSGAEPATGHSLAEEVRHMASVHAEELSREHVDAITADVEQRFKHSRTGSGGP